MQKNEDLIDLIQLLKKKHVILFVGAGVPASIGMPTWSELIEKMCSDLHIDPNNKDEYSDFLQLASYYENIIGSKKPIQEFIEAHSKNVRPRINESIIYKMICRLGVRKLYTTNYDRTIEIAYHIDKIKHKTIRTIDDFTDIGLDPQIIKYHGDVKSLKNWVLSERDYFNRLDFTHPMDVKLKADLIGSSVLFIGYSFSDMNIRYLIYKINQLWQENKATKKVKSFIFISDLKPIKENILRSYGIVPIYGYGKDPKKGLESFLTDICKELEMLKVGENINE
jgi:hypothetical protein